MCSHSRPIQSFSQFCSEHNYASEWLYCPTVQCYTMCSLCLKIKFNNKNNTLSVWSDKWRFKFHPEKCKVMHLGKAENTEYFYKLKEGDTLHEMAYLQRGDEGAPLSIVSGGFKAEHKTTILPSKDYQSMK